MSNTATANMKIVSDFALLDVKQGRGALLSGAKYQVHPATISRIARREWRGSVK
jgi:hypothetical protein